MFAAFHLAALVLLAQAPAAPAADQPPALLDPQSQEKWQEAQQLARHGLGELLRSLELFKDSLPAYGAPYIDRNGNIVIPRMAPQTGAPPERKSDRS